jgi:hypothetical protein
VAVGLAVFTGGSPGEGNRVIASDTAHPTAATAAADPTAGTAAADPAAAAEPTVWLCRPGVEPNPCRIPLDTTVVTADGRTTVETPELPTAPLPVDCFFVYGTVSAQPTPNADLSIDPELVTVANGEAARFSTVCNVWAPVYRQRTLASAGNLDPVINETAYRSVHDAWQDYLGQHNDGRAVVFVGHSQGAAILTRLLREDVDGDAALRDRVVSAVLLGANVAVPVGGDVGATFQQIPACRTASQTGCVIAYSTFPSAPPPDAVFGIAGQGISAQSGQTERVGLEVLCTNPAALAGGPAPLQRHRWLTPDDPLRQQVTTDWVAFPDMYAGECHRDGRGAAWLEPHDVSDLPATWPRLVASQGPRFGFHIYDVNVALGDLVALVEQQATAYAATH